MFYNIFIPLPWKQAIFGKPEGNYAQLKNCLFIALTPTYLVVLQNINDLQ